ncbi:hypothetical protein LX15_004783 [Streptoalloteichus tenebrarius]|uniref:Uncharacterized protein n=1 Tax=Streptoalloteichus tenebrarius (strain ATCC 17920 / DSM 40477 / JCM 4838 / CBS 697.72 / NBRC 16177 / NCIMB 11028 / NRRL B-12390 / A12253. 1 / ISP 5477) TaxID=1933 RepID=A0ABT1HZU9_STRSD|nr:hypothetical protein [Streptoalloteichus tenebrarius]MCP2261063.1 hypothetical protein [Streptoalloteichus tenebrarius]BFF03141.1 hypothetical protein GCM10020241_48160 [Streptoalloteichus tenebrarius]
MKTTTTRRLASGPQTWVLPAHVALTRLATHAGLHRLTLDTVDVGVPLYGASDTPPYGLAILCASARDLTAWARSIPGAQLMLRVHAERLILGLYGEIDTMPVRVRVLLRRDYDVTVPDGAEDGYVRIAIDQVVAFAQCTGSAQ